MDLEDVPLTLYIDDSIPCSVTLHIHISILHIISLALPNQCSDVYK